MAMYGVYCPECEELWDETFINIDDAATAIKGWTMNDGISELERYQIVELKPVAKLEAEFQIKLEYLN